MRIDSLRDILNIKSIYHSLVINSKDFLFLRNALVCLKPDYLTFHFTYMEMSLKKTLQVIIIFGI